MDRKPYNALGSVFLPCEGSELDVAPQLAVVVVLLLENGISGAKHTGNHFAVANLVVAASAGGCDGSDCDT